MDSIMLRLFLDWLDETGRDWRLASKSQMEAWMDAYEEMRLKRHEQFIRDNPLQCSFP